MRLDEAETYRSTEVNRDLWLMYHGAELIGQVRRGMDNHWYPELPAEHYRSAAMQRVIIAHEAINEYLEAADGNR